MSSKKNPVIKKIYTHDFFESPNTPCLSHEFWSYGKIILDFYVKLHQSVTVITFCVHTLICKL